jgi:hypothetical protein
MWMAQMICKRGGGSSSIVTRHDSEFRVIDRFISRGRSAATSIAAMMVKGAARTKTETKGVSRSGMAMLLPWMVVVLLLGETEMIMAELSVEVHPTFPVQARRLANRPASRQANRPGPALFPPCHLPLASSTRSISAPAFPASARRRVAGLALDLETESNGDQQLEPKSDACASSVKANNLVGQAVAGAERLDVSTQVDGWNVA